MCALGVSLVPLSAWAGLSPSAEASRFITIAKVMPRLDMDISHRVRHVGQGAASWYGPGFNGRRTASGEIFDQTEMTAAHRTLPLRTLVRVTRLDTGDSVMVRINDRGPFADDRVIDVSRAAAEALDFVEDGLAEVVIESLGPAERIDQAAPARFMASSRMASAGRTAMAAGSP